MTGRVRDYQDIHPKNQLLAAHPKFENVKKQLDCQQVSTSRRDSLMWSVHCRTTLLVHLQGSAIMNFSMNAYSAIGISYNVP